MRFALVAGFLLAELGLQERPLLREARGELDRVIRSLSPKDPFSMSLGFAHCPFLPVPTPRHTPQSSAQATTSENHPVWRLTTQQCVCRRHQLDCSRWKPIFGMESLSCLLLCSLQSPPLTEVFLVSNPHPSCRSVDLLPLRLAPEGFLENWLRVAFL